MGNLRLKGNDLKKIGFLSDTTKSIAINIVSKHYKHNTKDEITNLLIDVLKNPEKYTAHSFLSPLANEFIEQPEEIAAEEVLLNTEPLPFSIFGKKQISMNTIRQMEKAMLLPIAEKGALMPDAHEGYGLPIGSVFATKNSVVPYGVGLDIGCRMALTVFAEDDKFLKRYSYQIKTALKEHTHFGISAFAGFNYDHEVLDRPEFREIDLAIKFHGKAHRQLGTSGSGNHFVEFGSVEFSDNNAFNMPEGRFVALLTHSGSRGFGAEIAKHYTNVAMNLRRMPKGFQHLAWLDLNTEEGIEYWKLMNLAGDYAKANHDLIHESLTKAIGLSTLLTIENHHNFAWKESINGDEYIVHRKGATPAGNGVSGIIPGSMTQPGYIVTGKGESDSMLSASHGAGRKITRTKARNSITMSEVRKHLKQSKVTLLGGGVDESPFVYKDLELIMPSQSAQVKIEGKFHPGIVRMDKS